MINLTQQEREKLELQVDTDEAVAGKAPGSIREYYFQWQTRNNPKIRWQLDKLKKKVKGKCLIALSPEVDGFCQINVYNPKTMDRLFTLFADIDDATSVLEMNRLINDRLALGAQLITHSRK